MEKGDVVESASTNFYMRTSYNQQTFTLLWNIERFFKISHGKPLEVELDFYFDADTTESGTCRLKRSLNNNFIFEIILKFDFQCKVTFCNKVKAVLHKHEGESFVNDSNDQLFLLDVDFRTLQNLSTEELLIVCTVVKNKTRTVKSDPWNYLQDLTAIIKKQPASFLKEKVILRIYQGRYIASVNKAVLCGNSLVFADMLQTNKEGHKNILDLADMEFPVLEHMVAFLHSGILRCEDFYLLCSLHSAANKYSIKKLQDTCSQLLSFKLNVENVCEVLALSAKSKDSELKNKALLFFKDHAESVLVTDQWCNLMRDELELGIEAINIIKLQYEKL